MATDRKDIRLEYHDREGYAIVEETDKYVAVSYPSRQSYFGGGEVGPGLMIYFFTPSGAMTGSLDVFFWIPEISVEENIAILTGLKKQPKSQGGSI